MTRRIHRHIYILYCWRRPISVAAWSKPWACGRSLTGNTDSNSSGEWMSVSWECYVLSGRKLTTRDREALPSVGCLNVTRKPRQWGSPELLGAVVVIPGGEGDSADKDTNATKYKARLIRIWEIWGFNSGVFGWTITDVCEILVPWTSRVNSPRILMTSHRVFNLFNNNISCTSYHSSLFPNIDCCLKFKVSLPTFNIYYFYPFII